MAKYLALSVLGRPWLRGRPALATALEAPTHLYLGRPATTLWSVGLPILAVLVLALGVIGFTWLALRRIGRISPSRLCGGTSTLPAPTPAALETDHPCRLRFRCGSGRARHSTP